MRLCGYVALAAHRILIAVINLWLHCRELCVDILKKGLTYPIVYVKNMTVTTANRLKYTNTNRVANAAL